MPRDSKQTELVPEVGAEDRSAEDLNAPIAWEGLPAFHPAPKREIVLVVTCDTEAARDEAIEKLGLVIAKKTKLTWSAWYPPREREDLSALRFDLSGDPGEFTTPFGDAPESEARMMPTSATGRASERNWPAHDGHPVEVFFAYDGAAIGATCLQCREALDPPPTGALLPGEEEQA